MRELSNAMREHWPSTAEIVWACSRSLVSNKGSERGVSKPLPIKLVEPIERGGRQHMHGGQSKNIPRGSEVGDRVPEVEALHVWPVLLGIHFSGRPLSAALVFLCDPAPVRAARLRSAC